MSNPYYVHGGTPATGASGSSAAIRSEFDLITAGFALLPTLSGFGNKAIVVNAGGTALTTTVGSLALAGNLTTTGAFNLTLALGATVTLTAPLVSGTLATLAGTETFTFKTLTSPVLGGVIVGVYTLAGTPTINAPIFSGSITGTYTLAGTPTITAPAISAPVLSGTATGTYTLAGTPTITAPAITSAVLTTSTVAADPSAALGIASKQYADGQTGLLAMVNASVTVTMAANAVTIALKGNDGNDPSATNIARFLFRSVTATTAALVSRAVTGALSTVISSGSTGGTVNGVPARIYFGVLDNAGTVELYWWNSVSGTDLYAPPETEFISTTAEGGAGAADSAHVLYSTTARTNVPHRVLGYFEVTEATAGTWATDKTKVQLMGPGVKRTGDVVRTVRNPATAVVTGTTNIPIDDTIPQITEGDEYSTCAITPTNAINLLAIEHVGSYGISTASGWTIALFQDATANALVALADVKAINGRANMVMLKHVVRAATIVSTTFRTRAGGTGGVTTTLNGEGGVRLYGGVSTSFLSITEVFV